MSGAVYLLCAATSFLCAVMLLRGYLTTHVRLLMWSSLCFFGLTFDNLLLYLDLVILPEIHLNMWRRIPGFIATTLLIIGLVWDTK
jgi:hypothetical protein